LNTQKMSSEIQNLKTAQRLLLKKQNKDLSSADREIQNLRLNENLKLSLQKSSGKWGAFCSLPSEPDIRWSELNSNIEWYFVQTEEQKLKFVKDNVTLEAQDLEGICVPALGFNVNGARLGRGGGFYDRGLQNYNGKKIGISYDFAVSRDVPFEAHDIKVDVIVTDRRIVDAT
jgi:5-formyltetrahydrofolate cyclo-ligase